MNMDTTTKKEAKHYDTLEELTERVKNYNEAKQQFPTTGDVPEMTPITEKSPEMVTVFVDFK
jgi:hypothetical protein